MKPWKEEQIRKSEQARQEQIRQEAIRKAKFAGE